MKTLLKSRYSDFVKAIREVKECSQDWDVVLDLTDGEISVKHNSQTCCADLTLVRGYHINSEFDCSAENIDGTFGREFIEDAVDGATCGAVKVEVI